MSGGIAIELGSTRTRVADASGQLLVDEPTIAAVDLQSGELVAFGAAALPMPGRAAGDVALTRPVSHGQLQDLELTDDVAHHLLDRVARAAGRRPRVLLAVPGLASGVHRRALERSFKSAGASEVGFIEQAVAAAIGCDLAIAEPVATMVVDVGGGTTDVAVMALGGIVTEASIPLGGEDLDNSIRELALRSFDLVLSPEIAERVKFAIGSAWPGPEKKVEVPGRNAWNGQARNIVLSRSEVAGALSDIVQAMVRAPLDCLVTSPPDLANDLLARGLHLVGEGSQVAGFARRLATETGMAVHRVDDPGSAAVIGAARCLSGSNPNKPDALSAAPAGSR